MFFVMSLLMMMKAVHIARFSARMLRTFCQSLVSLIEWVSDITFVTHFILYEAESRQFIGVTLFFISIVTYVKILSTSFLLMS